MTSFEVQLRQARLVIARVGALPRSSDIRQRANVAAREGATAFESRESRQTADDNPHSPDSTEAAAWLLGWSTRSREEA